MPDTHSSLDPKVFGRTLRAERERLALSAEQVAEAAKLSIHSQRGYERGDRLPDAAYLASLWHSGFDVGLLLTGVSNARHALRNLNTQLLAELVELIDAWCLEHGVKMQPQRRLDLLFLLAELCMESPKTEPHSTTVARLLKAVA